MNLKEIISNNLEIDDDFILEYFDTLEGKNPTVEDLIAYIDMNYYLSDFITECDINYVGDDNELLRLYKLYKK